MKETHPLVPSEEGNAARRRASTGACPYEGETKEEQQAAHSIVAVVLEHGGLLV